ncbi:MAG: DUF4870 domain-containing protein [Microbacteriaceae bacterium]|nr:DUF4870 domain-containing protein [Microbacteriaceae bacterium]
MSDQHFPNHQAPRQPAGDERTTLMWAHLLNIVGILGPLLFWLVTREKGPAYDREGKEAVNWAITVLAASLVASFVGFLPFLGWLGSLLWAAVWIVNIAFAVLGGVETSRKGGYKYPYTFGFIK